MSTKKTAGRPGGRKAGELRPVGIERGYLKQAAGSALVSFGMTRVLCAASVEDSVPPFLRGKGQGWVTAEYGMLPASTNTRQQREAARGKQSGRTLEIQRLIGRSLRSVVDLKALGERSITLDCDVIEADGGTRTAAVTGSWVALVDAVRSLIRNGTLPVSSWKEIVTGQVAAVSVGIVGGRVALDLCYEEDSAAETDMNVVMTGEGGYVELQGTAERGSFSERELRALLACARKGIAELLALQRRAAGVK